MAINSCGARKGRADDPRFLAFAIVSRERPWAMAVCPCLHAFVPGYCARCGLIACKRRFALVKISFNRQFTIDHCRPPHILIDVHVHNGVV